MYLTCSNICGQGKRAWRGHEVSGLRKFRGSHTQGRGSEARLTSHLCSRLPGGLRRSLATFLLLIGCLYQNGYVWRVRACGTNHTWLFFSPWTLVAELSFPCTVPVPRAVLIRACARVRVFICECAGSGEKNADREPPWSPSSHADPVAGSVADVTYRASSPVVLSLQSLQGQPGLRAPAGCLMRSNWMGH